jgi:hypothetical protein
MTRNEPQIVESEWVTFPGGELEGRRPKALCPDCRARLHRATVSGGQLGPRPICFQCYRAELARERALTAAGDLETASVERFQSALPFEPVNGSRLALLKAERHQSRVAMAEGAGRFVTKRHEAQIAARHALEIIAAGLHARRLEADDRERVMASAIHAAELQLPEAWLPFVVSR